jgi:KGK domain
MRRRRVEYLINVECNNVEAQMNREFIQLRNNSDDEDTVLSFPWSMFKLSNFINSVHNALQDSGLDTLKNQLKNRGGISGDCNQWYRQGVDCELLKPGTKGWKKGKLRIKISLEFSPDEPEIDEIPVNQQINITQPESPLDDIRRTMNQNT